MKNILVVESSQSGEASFSRKLTREIVGRLIEKNPGIEVRTHDLAAKPFPHLTGAHLGAFFTAPDKHTDAQKQLVSHSEEAIADIMAADAIVIGVSMYNLSIPSVLKAWIDHVSRAGRTFRYGANGPEGLVKGKKVYLAIASGGVYSQGPSKSYDFSEPYLRAALGFLGMTDVTVFRVEGVAIPGLKETALDRAFESVNWRNL